MFDNTTGSFNTAVGDDALDTNVDGNSNVAIGDEAGTGLVPSVNNCIAIGVPGAGPFAVLDNTCFIGSIFDQPVSDVGTQEAVFVDQFNVVGIAASSRRFKHDIQPMDKASEAILALKPVTFKYNADKNGRTQYGLIAEEVATVNPDLVVRTRMVKSRPCATSRSTRCCSTSSSKSTRKCRAWKPPSRSNRRGWRF